MPLDHQDSAARRLWTCGRSNERYSPQYCGWSALVSFIAITFVFISHVLGQTAATGSLTGVTLDPSGAVLPGVLLRLVNQDTAETQSATSDGEGRFRFLLLSPGSYRVEASKIGFDPLRLPELNITVTETLRIDLHLRLATVVGSVQVSSEPEMVQTDDAALGRVVNGKAVSGLPLVTRNFAQIAGLSPGVVAGVFNAGELGLGGTAQSQISPSNDGIFVHGSRSYENDWQLDGISVSDVQGSGSSSGGIPIPNPDAIQEFKVQTGLYGAAYGRYAGANVSVITKMGGNAYHGTIFEFFRNNVLNANDFFFNQTGEPRPTLKQNQFGFALGGPIKRDKLFFFGSYQGTRQVNGLAAGQTRIACSASLSEPPLTSDRSPAALGKLFGGMTGALGGVAVKADGSNINPIALALLNFKLADGSFLIPTPQTVDPSKPIASQGFSVFTQPCHFTENQMLANMDYVASQKSKLTGRFFLADDNETVTFPGNGLNPSGNINGFPSPLDSGFRVFSVAHTYSISSTWLNEARIGYVRNRTSTAAITPFSWSDVGVAEGEMNDANELPSLNILGSVSVASGYPRTFTQNSYILSDDLSFVHGAHTVRFGGSVTRLQDNVNIVGFGSFLQFLSWPDFLLGLAGSNNGTGIFSNVFASVDDFGLLNREYRVWEAAAFAQDDYRISKSLTLNLGLRYERLGQFGDNLGRNSSFDINRADPNPPAGGSLAGYVVASNFSGSLPPGVVRANNNFADDGGGQNTLSPRIGFAWQILPSGRLLLRGGYGMYYSRTTGQTFFQSVFGAPYSLARLNVGPANAEATFQTPFQQPFPTPASFPLFPPYSPSSAVSISTVAQNFRPAAIQQYSLNLQGDLHEGWLLEVGYVGAEGERLLRSRSLNQAMDASPTNPVRGVTTNTVANIPLRVPIVGVPPNALFEVESEGSSWYNGLEVSLTKRLSHGLQFLASYTFSKTLDTDGADINSTSAGVLPTLGDQNSPSQRWGRASFDRTHRFVFSTTWTLPSPGRGVPRATLGGWALAGVVTIQSGSALTIADTNSTNVFGISRDRAQLTGNCTKAQLVTGGSVESKLNNYFNMSCFITPPVIGADGVGTAFGDSGTGIVDGPGQANLDLALSKMVSFDWPREKSNLEFRAEFYNSLNHPQFANPDSNFTSPTFGLISSTAVSARVGQLALKFSF
jgi:Carboxypeptidase regulatory-like domain/TonB dependent receptor